MTREYTLTVTSKGQFTMPAPVRKAFGISDKGGMLILRFNPSTKQAKIEQPISFNAIQQIAAKFIKPGIKPLENPRDFYENRESRR